MTSARRQAATILLIVLAGFIVGVAIRLGEPSLPDCPHHQTTATRCAP